MKCKFCNSTNVENKGPSVTKINQETKVKTCLFESYKCNDCSNCWAEEIKEKETDKSLE